MEPKACAVAKNRDAAGTEICFRKRPRRSAETSRIAAVPIPENPWSPTSAIQSVPPNDAAGSPVQVVVA